MYPHSSDPIMIQFIFSPCLTIGLYSLMHPIIQMAYTWSWYFIPSLLYLLMQYRRTYRLANWTSQVSSYHDIMPRSIRERSGRQWSSRTSWRVYLLAQYHVGNEWRNVLDVYGAMKHSHYKYERRASLIIYSTVSDWVSIYRERV